MDNQEYRRRLEQSRQAKIANLVKDQEHDRKYNDRVFRFIDGKST